MRAATSEMLPPHGTLGLLACLISGRHFASVITHFVFQYTYIFCIYMLRMYIC